MSLLLLLQAMLIMDVGSCGNANFIGIQRKSCDRIKSVTKQWNKYKEVRLTTFLMYIKLIDKASCYSSMLKLSAYMHVFSRSKWQYILHKKMWMVEMNQGLISVYILNFLFFHILMLTLNFRKSSMSMSPNCCSHGIGRMAIYVTKQF